MKHLVSLFLFLLLSKAAFASPYGLGDLKETIDKNHVTKIEELLPLLPMDLRQNFTLMTESRSLLQGASELNPRALLFGSTGKLILTFNGDEKQDGNRSVELISFDERKKRFELREIIFRGAGAPEWSAPNPERCTLCHGSSPRPLWSEYRNWKGALGRDDDHLGMPPEDAVKIGLKDEHDENFDMAMKLRSHALLHPRYRWLGWKGEDRCFPYHCKLNPLEKSFLDSPNTRLTMLMTVNFAVSLADRASRSKNFFAYKSTLAWGMMCSEARGHLSTAIDRIAPSTKIPYEERWTGTFEDWIKDVKDHDAILNLFDVAYGSTSTALRIDDPGDLDIRERGGGVAKSTKEDEATGPQPIRGAYVGNGMAVSSMMTGLQIARIVGKTDQALERLINQSSGWNDVTKQVAEKAHAGGYESEYSLYKSDDDFGQYMTERQAFTTAKKEICVRLKELSANELIAAPPRPAAVHQERPKNWTPGWEILAKSKCIDCHNGGLAAAPLIPFNNPEVFAMYIKSINFDYLKRIEAAVTKEGHVNLADMDFSERKKLTAQMPYVGAALSVTERKILMDYLRNISK